MQFHSGGFCLKRLKIKFKPFIFVNDYGEAVLAIQCPKCDFPVSILNPLREIYDDLKTGMIFIRANCYHCKTGSLNELHESELSKIERFVEEFCVKEPSREVSAGRTCFNPRNHGEKF